jgi:hypothetical protein
MHSFQRDFADSLTRNASTFEIGTKSEEPSQAELELAALESLGEGSFVRIREGILKGLAGTLVRAESEGRCLVQSSEFAPGVYLCLSAGSLAACQ